MFAVSLNFLLNFAPSLVLFCTR